MRPSSKERGGHNLTGFNRRATRLGGMQQPSNPVVILARTLRVSGAQEAAVSNPVASPLPDMPGDEIPERHGPAGASRGARPVSSLL